VAKTKGGVWELPPHTAAKHEILRRYLGAWYPKMANSGFRGRLIFLDAFAGPGVYEEGEEGSPLIALRTLVEHSHFSRWSRTSFLMVFVEEDATNYALLNEAVGQFWQTFPEGCPPNVEVRLIHGSFADVGEAILERVAGKSLAPTFAFVDPFGFKGVPMDLLARLLAYKSCEVFFNFMSDSINRFITHPDDAITDHLEQLFGTDDFYGAAGLSGPERRNFLLETYEQGLHKIAGFRHVHRFEMNRKGRPVYSLFFGTRSLDGVEVMKDAMWAVDPIEGCRFSDRYANADVLFQPEPDLLPLRHGLLEHFAGQAVSIKEVEDYVLAETPYKKGHIKRKVLVPLERERVITGSGLRQRPFTFPPGTTIQFP